MALERLAVDAAVFALRPDFVVVAIVADGLVNAPSDDESIGWLAEAERLAVESGPPESDAHVISWQHAYRAFGAKPQRTPSSVEALWRRAMGPAGLPRVNWLVDAYNAVSVTHRLPVGGEDLAQFVGPIRLVRATGSEQFDTVKDGAPAVESPLPGEVVWRDDVGVTCRRWNWRQGTRTRLTESTTSALFLLERLEGLPLDALHRAADAVAEVIRRRQPHARIDRTLFEKG